MNVNSIPETTTLVREATDVGKVVGKTQTDQNIDGPRTKPGESRLETKAVKPLQPDNFGVRLQFAVDKDTGERLVRVLDPETGEVLRQFPPEELLHLMKTLRDLKGVFLSTRL
jgi:flagellar protein FlaG